MRDTALEWSSASLRHFSSCNPALDWSAVHDISHQLLQLKRYRTYDEMLDRHQTHLVRVDVFNKKVCDIFNLGWSIELHWFHSGVCSGSIDIQLKIFGFGNYLK
jgi:hypothetical protein